MRKLFTVILIAGANLSLAQQQYYDVTAANGNGLRFWSSDYYKVHMGNGAEYNYGPVYDYSIKTNMNPGMPGRGWTWGVAGSTPVAAINALGNMQIAGTFQSGKIIATGSASAEEIIFNATNTSDQDFQVKISAAGAATKRTIIGPSTAGRLSLGVNGANEYLTVVNSGNVGIGTTAPSNIQGWDKVLDVSAPNYSKILATASSQSYRVGIYAHTSWNGGGGFIGTESNHNLNFITNYNPKMTLDVNGNLGIGTSAPSGLLHVYSTAQYPRISVQSTSATGAPGFDILDASGTAKFTWHYDIGNGFMGFYQGGVGNRMVINTGGSVGIGTTNPDAKLDVRGNLVLEPGSNPSLFTGTGTSELNRYLYLVNSSAYQSASGLKAGGILISDSYSYANPGKNDLIVKGNVGIGTTNPGSYKLAVEGKIGAREVNVIATNPWPDYVFEKNYKLPSLEEIKNYIDQNQHLPEVPSAKEVERSGVNLGEMNALLLKKIEELTLYVIELKKENDAQNKTIKELINKSN